MDKIKAVNPNIIVRGSVDKPYYSIEYYDLSDNEWHIGYGSYYLANVKKWLKTYFEVTNADVAPVKHGHWRARMSTTTSVKCTCCNNCYEYKTPYCPNCGAKIDGETEIDNG